MDQIMLKQRFLLPFQPSGLSLIALLCWMFASAATAQEDPEYLAMAEGKGKDFTHLLCSDCHAMSHVLQKRYSRRGWRDAITRMTTDFGMAALHPDEKALVVDYLTEHYSPGSGR